MAIVVILVLLVLLGGIAWYRFEQAEKMKLAAMTPEARAAELERRAQRARELQEQLSQARAQAQQRRAAQVKHRPISQVANRADSGGMLICPNCGGTQFKARRSGARRLGIAATGIVVMPVAAAAAAAMAKKNRVECVTCGKQFGRG